MVVAAPPPHPHRLVHDGTASNEAIKGFVSGVAFGVASPLAAHPIDTIRVRMQALPALARGGSIAALRQTIATGGVRALWNGLLSPLLGSAVFRSLQMSSFAATVVVTSMPAHPALDAVRALGAVVVAHPPGPETLASGRARPGARMTPGPGCIRVPVAGHTSTTSTSSSTSSSLSGTSSAT